MFVFLALIDSENDRDKFSLVYEKYRNLMFYVARQILKNEQDAEDAVQEAFFSIAKNIGKISDPDSTKTKSFVVIITERKAIDILRKRRDMESIELDEELSGYEVNYDGEDLLVRFILELPARYREIIILKYYMGYDLKEIARILGIQLNNARQIDQRAKAKLRALCEENGYDI